MIGTVFKRDFFEKAQIENFQIKFRKLILQELKRARTQGKKLLVLIGESHNSRRILALQEIICEIASEVGIKNMLEEGTPETIQYILGGGKIFGKLLPKFYRKLIKLGMTVEGLEKYELECRDLPTYEGVDLRNGVMKNGVFNRNNDAIMFVGSNHLKGLLEERDNSLSEKMGAPKKYHIVPMNLSSLLSQVVDTTRDHKSVLRHTFSLDKNKVIQIPNLNIDEAEADKVIAQWNNIGIVEQEFKESKEQQEVDHLNQQRIAREKEEIEAKEKAEAQAKALREQEKREFSSKLLQITLDLEVREAERKAKLEVERQEVEADRQDAEAVRQRQTQKRELSDMLVALSLSIQKNANLQVLTDARLAQELADPEKAILLEKSQRNNNQGR